MMLLESKFQSELIKKIKKLFPDCIVLKNDPTYLQGFPDLLILYKNKWVALEVKRSINARKGNNQQYWIDVANDMSGAWFVYPENKERVLDEIRKTFRSSR